MHGSLLSACKAVPGICVVQPEAWPARYFGRTELERNDKDDLTATKPTVYATLKF